MLPRRPNSAGKRLFTGSLDDLCLRFVDTRYCRGSDPPTETLGSLADVVAWCLESAVLDEADAAGLRAWASAHPAQAGQLYADIVEARRFLIILESFITALIVVFATMVFFKWETPNLLLGTTFLLSASWSLAARWTC